MLNYFCLGGVKLQCKSKRGGRCVEYEQVPGRECIIESPPHPSRSKTAKKKSKTAKKKKPKAKRAAPATKPIISGKLTAKGAFNLSGDLLTCKRWKLIENKGRQYVRCAEYEVTCKPDYKTVPEREKKAKAGKKPLSEKAISGKKETFTIATAEGPKKIKGYKVYLKEYPDMEFFSHEVISNAGKVLGWALSEATTGLRVSPFDTSKTIMGSIQSTRAYIKRMEITPEKMKQAIKAARGEKAKKPATEPRKIKSKEEIINAFNAGMADIIEATKRPVPVDVMVTMGLARAFKKAKLDPEISSPENVKEMWSYAIQTVGESPIFDEVTRRMAADLKDETFAAQNTEAYRDLIRYANEDPGWVSFIRGRVNQDKINSEAMRIGAETRKKKYPESLSEIEARQLDQHFARQVRSDIVDAAKKDANMRLQRIRDTVEARRLKIIDWARDEAKKLEFKSDALTAIDPSKIQAIEPAKEASRELDRLREKASNRTYGQIFAAQEMIDRLSGIKK